MELNNGKNFFLASLVIIMSACSSLQSSEHVENDGRPQVQVPSGSTEHRALDTSDFREPEVSDASVSLGTDRLFQRTQPDIHEDGNDARSMGQSFIFDNARLETILAEVLGDGFGASFFVDPSFSSQFSVRLSGIRSVEQAITALNAILSSQGYYIQDTGGVYIVSRGQPSETSSSTVSVLDTAGQLAGDTGTAILFLNYLQAERFTRLIEPIVANGLRVRADTELNAVTISGTARAVAEVFAVARSLDVDWLRAVSYMILPLSDLTPTEAIEQLEPVFSQLGGVQFIPLGASQSLLVISNQADRLEPIRDFLVTIDRAYGDDANRRIFVYEARFLDADVLLEGVSDLFSDTEAGVSATQDSGGGSQASARGLANGLRLSVDRSRNAILARGDPQELEELASLLEELDQEEPQILIEATIVEVTLSDGFRFGVQWQAIEDQLQINFNDASSGDVTARFPGASLSYVDTNIQAVVNALSNLTEVEIVSSPRVTTLNNRVARLQVGDQVPVITQSAVSVSDSNAPVVNSVNFRDTGVILEVRPRYRGQNMVEIEVSQEVSAVAETTTSNIDSPTITQRQIESVLVVPDGATAVLGGLISSTRSTAQTGIPLLEDIPGIGGAFRAQNNSERRTELIVLLRPSLVDTRSGYLTLSEQIAQALDRVRPDYFE